MANFDPNHWQQINISPNGENTGVGQSMDGSVLFTKQGSGSVFFTDTKTSAAEQLWQIFTFNSSYYVLRTQGSGPGGYMNTGLNPNESTPGKTVPQMANYSISDNSMFWQIVPWGDGTFYFANAANGTTWHLAIKPNSLMVMTSNITAPQDAQRFSFTQMGTIDDARFSSVVLASAGSPSAPSTATSPASSSLSTSIPSPDQVSISQTGAVNSGTGSPTLSPAANMQTSASTNIQISTSTNIQTSSATNAKTTSATNGQTQIPIPASHTGISAGAAAGIGVGIGAVVIMLIVVIGVLCRWKGKGTLKALLVPYEISAEPPSFQHVQDYKNIQEMGVHVPLAELPEANHRGQMWAEWPGHN